ncbi:hypothetical protein AC1031_010911 [Aphanomyces cochlioides]|nr:hypothetical protein AC1031_010911 [Aphanomyces cochlioides]
MDHHIKAATSFFSTLHEFRKRKCAVVFGQKQQGKSQFLYFLAKLLIALGEGVVYLDQTIAPPIGKHVAVIDKDCCLHLWQPSLETFLTANGGQAVIDTLRAFRGDPNDFSNFDTSLYAFCKEEELRVWMIVDEATSDRLQNFPITWPEEQYLTPFHFVLTGSVGIAKFVTERHLESQVWDLPLFDLQETASLALRLLDALNLPTEVIEGAFGLNLDLDDEEQKEKKIGEFLDGLFGGVPGYIAELFLAITKNGSLTSYMASLNIRVRGIVKKALGVNIAENAELWLNTIKQVTDPWSFARDAGLCGSTPPRGAIFRYMLEALSLFAPQVKILEIVKNFRALFDGDPGLDGILMELEVILKLQHEEPIQAALIKLNGGEWVPEAKVTDFPPSGTQLTIWNWNGDRVAQRCNDTSPVAQRRNDSSSKWHCVLLPVGFCVLDVLLVDCDSDAGEMRFYLVQITRSERPFHSHETNETCPTRSKTMIDALLAKTKEAICPTNTVPTEEKLFYVMVAPNCKTTQYSPPARHQQAFYFSPRPQTEPAKKRIPREAKKTSETEEVEMAQAVEQKPRATKKASETSSDDLSKSKKRKTNKSRK